MNRSDPRDADDASPPPRVRGRRLSAILQALAAAEGAERISLGDLVDAFGSRAFGALIAIFAAPNMLPVALPGISAVLGAPLVILCWQLMLGRPRPWLPRVLRARSLARTDFEALARRIAPIVARIERMVRPRLLWMTEPFNVRLIGAFGVVLALVILLPIPFGNALPGFALVLMALGVLERDGLAVAAGLVAGLIGIAVVSGTIYAAGMALMLLARGAFGL